MGLKKSQGPRACVLGQELGSLDPTPARGIRNPLFSGSLPSSSVPRILGSPSPRAAAVELGSDVPWGPLTRLSAVASPRVSITSLTRAAEEAQGSSALGARSGQSFPHLEMRALVAKEIAASPRRCPLPISLSSRLSPPGSAFP